MSTPTGPAYGTSTGTVIRLEGSQRGGRSSRRRSTSNSRTTTSAPATSSSTTTDSITPTNQVSTTPATPATEATTPQTSVSRPINPTNQPYTTIQTRTYDNILRNRPSAMSENVPLTESQAARVKNLERDVEGQRTRETTEDEGLTRVRDLARFVTGGRTAGPAGYEERSFRGKVEENVVTGLLAWPQMLGRGLATAGEKVVLSVQAASIGGPVSQNVAREYGRAIRDSQLKDTFDITTPEGATTYLTAASGAGFSAAGRSAAAGTRGPRVIRADYTQTTSRVSGGTTSRGVIAGPWSTTSRP